MQTYEAVRGFIQRMTRLQAYVGMVLLIPLMLLTSAEAIGEGLRRFDIAWVPPIPAISELSSYLLAIFILLGVAYTHQVKGHVRVTMLASRLPPRAAAGLDIVTTLLSLFIIAILCWQGWEVGLTERTVSDMLRIPQMPFRLLVGLAALFLALELCLDLAEAVRKLAGR